MHSYTYIANRNLNIFKLSYWLDYWLGDDSMNCHRYFTTVKYFSEQQVSKIKLT